MAGVIDAVGVALAVAPAPPEVAQGRVGAAVTVVKKGVGIIGGGNVYPYSRYIIGSGSERLSRRRTKVSRLTTYPLSICSTTSIFIINYPKTFITPKEVEKKAGTLKAPTLGRWGAAAGR